MSLDAERRALLDEYLRLVTFEGRRPELHPEFASRVGRSFAAMTPREARSYIEERRPYAERANAEWLRDAEKRGGDASERYPSLETASDAYERSNGVHLRVVCSDRNPMLEKKGMPLFKFSDSSDVELKGGYFGIHVGDPDEWLPILMRDGYCDGEHAFVYAIDASLAYATRQPFYEMEDFHVRDKGATPSSTILFSRRKVVPAKMIRLERVVDLADVAPLGNADGLSVGRSRARSARRRR